MKKSKKEGKRSPFRGKVAKNSRKQRKQESAYGYLQIPEGVKLFKEVPGKRATFDHIPYTVSDPKHMDRDDEVGIAIPGSKWYRKPFRIHRNVGGATVVCPSTVGKKCCICQYRKKRIDSGANKKETDKLKYSNRNLYGIVPRDMKDYKEEAHLWDISQAMYQKMLNEEIDDNEKYEVFPDPEEGFTIKARFSSETIPDERTGKSSKPFAKTSRIDFEEREEPIDPDILDSSPDLDKCLIILSDEELKKKFFESDENGGDDEDGEEDDGEYDEEEEGDEVGEHTKDDEDEDAEDEDEDEKPKGGERRRHHKEDEDEDEGGDGEDDGDRDVCVACEGTGKNSKGRTCRICGGSGEKKVEEEPEEEEPTPPSKRTKRNAEPPDKPGKKSSKCPFGHKFGKDCDDYDDCDRCQEDHNKTYEKCFEETDA